MTALFGNCSQCLYSNKRESVEVVRSDLIIYAISRPMWNKEVSFLMISGFAAIIIDIKTVFKSLNKNFRSSKQVS